jgi:hypothetical protein
VADTGPAAFVALTRQASEWPLSELLTAYVAPPATGVPLRSQTTVLAAGPSGL